MNTVKRRTIWLSDEEWARVVARANREGVNTSNLIRRTTLGEPSVNLSRLGTPTAAAWDVEDDHFGTSRPAPKPGR